MKYDEKQRDLISTDLQLSREVYWTNSKRNFHVNIMEMYETF